MNQQPEQASKNSPRVKFIDFWMLVAKELDHARLHLNPRARSVDKFIRERSDLRAYLHRAIKASYKESACKNLESAICLEAVLDVLGETAYNLEKEGCCDLFDIELLEEIAWLISDRYTQQVQTLLANYSTKHAQSVTAKLNSTPSAAVVSFPDYKIRRANARL